MPLRPWWRLVCLPRRSSSCRNITGVAATVPGAAGRIGFFWRGNVFLSGGLSAQRRCVQDRLAVAVDRAARYMFSVLRFDLVSCFSNYPALCP